MKSFKKARVMVRRDLNIDTWHETHFGIIIQQNDWGAQIFDEQCPFNDLPPNLWEFVEWFPWNSRCQKIQLL